MKRVVILGTGTAVGKTQVTVALARALRAGGSPSVQALKPIETGLIESTDGRPPPDSDAGRLEAESFHVEPVRPHPRFAFRDPVSPHLAARRVAAPILLSQVADWANAVTLGPGPSPAYQLVETAGGVFSPVTDHETNYDLACALGPATWILVAPDALGVLHDVRAAIEALRHRGRDADYLVLSAARPPDASTGANAAELPRVGLPVPIAVLGRGALTGLEPLAAALLPAD